MNFDDLNELEKIGLAFMCGFAAAKSFDETEKEDKITDIKIEKIEGKEADKIIKMLDKLNFKEDK